MVSWDMLILFHSFIFLLILRNIYIYTKSSSKYFTWLFLLWDHSLWVILMFFWSQKKPYNGCICHSNFYIVHWCHKIINSASWMRNKSPQKCILHILFALRVLYFFFLYTIMQVWLLIYLINYSHYSF